MTASPSNAPLRSAKPAGAWLAAVSCLSLVGMAGALAATAQAQSAPAAASAPIYNETPPGAKPRVVVTTDPELDDSNSLLRYLLYTPDFRTEGLIYASSQFHWKGDGKGTTLSVPGREYTKGGKDLCPCTSWRWAPGDRFIDADLDVYAKAYANLRVHNHAYPTPQALRSVVRWGNVDFDGEMDHDTPGSDLIKQLLLDKDEAPIYLHAWGGQSTIARALKSIEDTYKDTPQWAAIRAKVVRKAIINPSGDQDDTYAKYIKPHWGDIRYMEQRGGISLSYLSLITASKEDAAFLTAEWTKANISSKGPMGAHYRVWGDGKQMAPGDMFDYFGIAGKSAKQLKAEGYHVWSPVFAPGSFISEGDTPTFLNLIDNGLAGYRPASFGGWGGVLFHNTETFQLDPGMMQAVAAMNENPSAPVTIKRAPTSLFMAAAQNDFAARMKWAVTPQYRGANHAPSVTLAGPALRKVHAGQLVTLSARTADPDGNMVKLRWWPYAEAGTYAGAVTLDKAQGPSARLRVPADARPGQTIHIVAEATDNGTPAMTHYARVVLEVQ